MKAATSKIVVDAPTSDFSTKRANSIDATPLGPNQAMNSFCGPGSRLRTKASQDRERPGDEQRQENEDDQPPDRPVVAGGDDQRAEDEEGDRLEDRADVLGELHEGVRDLVLGDAHRDPRDEGGDQAVADRHVRQPEGREAEAERVDPLVAGGDPAARQVVVQATADEPQHHAHEAPKAASPRSFARLAAGVSARLREDQEEEHEGQREAVVQPRLQIQGVPDQRGHA